MMAGIRQCSGATSAVPRQSETAKATCGRLRESGGYGCNPPPEYGIAEVTRADFASDSFGEEEWRTACREAGVDPQTGGLHTL